MLDYIIFAENMYPARKVAIEGYGSELIISTEDLEAVLINELTQEYAAILAGPGLAS